MVDVAQGRRRGIVEKTGQGFIRGQVGIRSPGQQPGMDGVQAVIGEHRVVNGPWIPVTQPGNKAAVVRVSTQDVMQLMKRAFPEIGPFRGQLRAENIIKCMSKCDDRLLARRYHLEPGAPQW